MNKWAEGMAVRVALSPFSGIICKTFNSVGQENFTLVRKKSGKSQEISEITGCGNHASACGFTINNWNHKFTRINSVNYKKG